MMDFLGDISPVIGATVSLLTALILIWHAVIFIKISRREQILRIRTLLMELYTDCLNEVNEDHINRIKDQLSFLIDEYDGLSKKRRNDYLIVKIKELCRDTNKS
jgi:hypothetical protein